MTLQIYMSIRSREIPIDPNHTSHQFRTKTISSNQEPSQEIKKFFKAVQDNKTDHVKKILANPAAHGINKSPQELCNTADEYGRTALHMTALHRHSDTRTAETLIEHGANLDAQDSLGWTPLHFPSNLNVSLLLIKKGALLSVRDVSGSTALNEAKTWENQEKITALQTAIALTSQDVYPPDREIKIENKTNYSPYENDNNNDTATNRIKQEIGNTISQLNVIIFKEKLNIYLSGLDTNSSEQEKRIAVLRYVDLCKAFHMLNTSLHQAHYNTTLQDIKNKIIQLNLPDDVVIILNNSI